MASTNKTPQGFNLWVESDKPKMEDFNTDNMLVDSALAQKANTNDMLQALNQKANQAEVYRKEEVYNRAESDQQFVAHSELPNLDIATINEALATKANANDFITTGMVATFARTTPPSGWLKANGATISRETYADLFAAIGTTFGVGDGVTTFTLPDLRGEFIRGWDEGRGVDSGRAFGNAQAEAYLSHSHGFNFSNAAGNNDIGNRVDFATGSISEGASSGFFSVGAAAFMKRALDGTTYPNVKYLTGRVSGGTETRPRNISLLACIKY